MPVKTLIVSLKRKIPTLPIHNKYGMAMLLARRRLS